MSIEGSSGSGCGKSEVAIQLIVQCILPEACGGLGGDAVIIDTGDYDVSLCSASLTDMNA